MRTSLLLASVGLPAALVACTALLGDFSVGGGDAGDAGGSDAPSDAPTLYALTCSETTGSRVPLTTGNALNAYPLRLGALSGGNLRVVLADFPQATDGGANTGMVLRGYTFDPHNITSSLATVNLPTTAYNVFSLIRYTGVTSGFAALFAAQDPNNSGNPALWVSKFPDDAPNWAPAQVLAPIPNSGNGNSEQGTFIAVDPATDKYFVAYSNTSGNTQSIYMGLLTPGSSFSAPPEQFQTQSANNPAFSFIEPGIAQGGTQPYVALLPNGNNGPPPLGAPVKILVPGGTDITITPPSNLNYFPSGFTSSVDPQQADVAFLVADLNSLTGSYRIGRVPYASLPTFDPQTLAATEPPGTDGGVSLTKLFVQSNTQHWESAGGQGEQYLMVAPTADPVNQTLLGGINFAWWDGATGILRAYQAGQGENLLSDVPYVVSADVTFETLVGSIAQLSAAFLDDVGPAKGGNAPPAGDLYFTTIGCLKGQ